MKLLVLYDTDSGTTEYVAKQMQTYLQQKGHQVTITRPAADLDINLYEGLLLGSPTYDHGQILASFNQFLQAFQPDLSRLKVGVFGLGSLTYTQFATAADHLATWVTTRKGKTVQKVLKIDGFPANFSDINAWLDEYCAG